MELLKQGRLVHQLVRVTGPTLTPTTTCTRTTTTQASPTASPVENGTIPQLPNRRRLLLRERQLPGLPRGGLLPLLRLPRGRGRPGRTRLTRTTSTCTTTMTTTTTTRTWRDIRRRLPPPSRGRLSGGCDPRSVPPAGRLRSRSGRGTSRPRRRGSGPSRPRTRPGQREVDIIRLTTTAAGGGAASQTRSCWPRLQCSFHPGALRRL